MSRFVIFLTATLFATVPSASAQTRYVAGEITGGSFNADTSIPMLRASYDITGPDFHFVADGVEPGAIYGAITCSMPGCRPGDRVSLSGTFSGSYLGAGLAVIGSDTLAPAYFSGVLTFVTNDVVIPPGNRKHLVLTTPFTLIGAGDESYPALNVWADSSGMTGEPWSTATLFGRGTATAIFRRDDYGKDMPERFYYVLDRVIYSFNTPAAVGQ